jgi:hydrogenase nickel incorporation protein HypA/HybF
VHELSVTENLLDISIRYGLDANAIKITDLFIVIGQLTTFIDDSIQFYWDFVSKDTIAEGAQLHFRRIPAQFQCLNCGTSYIPANGIDACPQCGDLNIKSISGDEFFLESIQIETTNENLNV